MKGIPIDYIFSLESKDRHYNKAQIQRHTRSQSIFFVTWHSLERRQCDKLDSFGPLPFSEEIKERLVIMSVPRMDVEAQENDLCLDKSVELCSFQSIVYILLRFFNMQSKKASETQTVKDLNFKKFRRAMLRNKFDFSYKQIAYFSSQILNVRYGPILARIKLKLQKIDIALKIVLKRNTRKNNVNYQENLSEFDEFIKKSQTEIAEESAEGRLFYFQRFQQISKQPQYLAYQQYQPQFLNEVLLECNNTKLPVLPLKEHLMELK